MTLPELRAIKECVQECIYCEEVKVCAVSLLAPRTGEMTRLIEKGEG